MDAALVSAPGVGHAGPTGTDADDDAVAAPGHAASGVRATATPAGPTEPGAAVVVDECAATPMQQGMLFNTLADPEAGVDLIQCLVTWDGPLDAGAVAVALARAAAAHPILRTGFHWSGSAEPTQRVWSHAAPLVEERAHPGDLTAFLAADRARGVEPAGPSLLRATVLRGAAVDTLVLTFHHVIIDGRTLAILLADLGRDIPALTDGAGLAAVEPSPPFTEFARWLTRRGSADPVVNPAGPAERAFWTSYLDGVAGATPLPSDRRVDGAAAAATRPTMGSVRSALTDDGTAAVRALATAAGVTVNAVVHAAWALVLGAGAAAPDVVFGVTRSARHASVDGADATLGLLLATVPVRVRVDRDATVADWLRAVRAAGTGARDHQLVPLADIQRCAGLAPGVPLVSSLVLFERQEARTALARVDPAWARRDVEILRNLSYPLALYAFAEPVLALQALYDERAFDRDTARALLRRVETVLLALAADPSGLVGDVALSPADERAALLRWGNVDGAFDRSAVLVGADGVTGTPEPTDRAAIDTDARFPFDETIVSRFAEHAAATPGADAVFDPTIDRWCSYRELDERSDTLAHALVDAGVRPDQPVAVSVPRGLDMIVAMLAVLKAGAAYLPLDPADPPARVATVLTDGGVTHAVIAAGAPALAADVASIPVTASRPTARAGAPAVPVPPHGLAYVTYTSGSTGRPKGVAVPHRGVVRLVHEPNFAVFDRDQTFLWLSASAFDLTTMEVWGALLNGGRVVVVPPGPHGPAEVAAMLRRHRVTVLWLTAGLFHQIVEHDAAALAGVDHLVAGGDALAPAAVRAAITARGPGSVLVDGYGPTENTTLTSCARLTSLRPDAETTPIGVPLQRTTVYVLDERLRPVPPGVPGVLWTGGDGLARGYLRNPALTASVFLPDPFARVPGARMYSTGDLARWRADGVLEFLGRADQQVKIRGFRVEPAEVEGLLRAQPGVGDAAVVARGDGESRHLVAYLVPLSASPGDADGAGGPGGAAPSDSSARSGGAASGAAASAIDVAAIRAEVGVRLAEYLWPRSYVVLDRLPLNASGKLDRAALPEPTPDAVAGGAFVAPATATERRLAGVWSALLGLRAASPAAPDAATAYDGDGGGDPGVGRDHDFFATGGNSLLAMRLTFRVREVFGVDLSVRDVYRERTLAELAAFVDARAATGGGVSTPGITRRDRSAYRATAAPTAPTAPPAPATTAAAEPPTDATATGTATTDAATAAPAAPSVPVTAAPVTDAPVTDAPVTDAPATAPPAEAGVATAAAPESAARADDRAPLADHLVAPDTDVLPDRNWSMWRCVELRGTGFGAGLLDGIGTTGIARAADALLDARADAAAVKWTAVAALRTLLAAETEQDRRALVYRASRLVRKDRYADLPAELAAVPEIAAARDAHERALAAARAYDDSFAPAHQELAARLHDVSGLPLFREAVAWQNPRALKTAVDALRKATAGAAAGGPVRRNAEYRRWESLVTMYLQRYCAKNDTIGFFGPVGWSWVVDQDAAIEVRPGDGLLDNRDVYLEGWAVDELGAVSTTDEVRPWVAPRLMPFVAVVERDGVTELHVPLTPPSPLAPVAAATLRRVDGLRRARDIAAEVATELPGTADTEVYAVLADAAARRRIAWTLEVPPAALQPEIPLRAQIARIEPAELRAPIDAALTELTDGRDEIAAAAGDPARLAKGIGDLQETFTRLTGAAALRRPGLFYAGRTMVYEECRRAGEVTVGPKLLDTLWPSLSLVLESARWYTSAGAAVYHRALLEIHRARVAETGSRVLRLADFWLWANDTIFRLDPRLVARITRALQEKWARVLDLPAELTTDLHREAAPLRERVVEAFAAPRPGWPTAVQHSPDVMIAAASEAAIRAGDFQWVLGELHAGVNTMRTALFVHQHKEPATLRAAMRADLGGPRVVLAETREQGGTPHRLADGLVQPDDLHVVFGHDTSGVDPAYALPVGQCLVEEVGGRLVVSSRDGRHRVDIVELLNEPLMGQLVQHFTMLPSRPYLPRITIDRLVVSRRRWSLAPADMAFAFAAEEPERFLQAQQWRREHGVPRHVFCKSPAEHKPFYVDLESLPSLELFAHATRAMERADATSRMSIGEMLPGPDDLWLTDGAGDRYTAEFRMVTYDRRGFTGRDVHASTSDGGQR